MRVLPYIVAAILGTGAAAAQVDPRNALVERAAWTALAHSEAGAAADAFRDALAADPRNARLHLGAALAASLERRDADAKRAAERALAIDPGMAEARALLGQILYRMHDLAGAVRVYEALAVDVAGARPAREARATLERWRRELALNDRMQEAIGQHFTVAFEGAADDALAARVLESLDRAYWRVGAILSVYPADPIRVVLYTQEQFYDITRSPAWAAGAYDGIVRVPMRGALAQTDELDRVLAHEFTHALIHTLAERGVPTWLNEGLASALESGDIEWAARFAAQRVSLEALRDGFNRFTGPQAVAAYATSAVAARRLLDEAGGVAVANLVRDLGDGAAFEAAFLRRIQRPFADFQVSPF